MKTRLAVTLGFCAVISLACGLGPEDVHPPKDLGTATTGLHRVTSISPEAFSYSEAKVHTLVTTTGTTWIVSAVHRTPSGDCALGSGPIGSPGYATGMQSDIQKCKDMCPGGVEGMRAAEDGQGGCKLQCDCKGDGVGYLDAPAVIDAGPLP